MVKLFNIRLQVVADDNDTEESVENKIEGFITNIKGCDLFINEVSYYGDIDEVLPEGAEDIK
jgi:hypothetical protein